MEYKPAILNETVRPILQSLVVLGNILQIAPSKKSIPIIHKPVQFYPKHNSSGCNGGVIMWKIKLAN